MEIPCDDPNMANVEISRLRAEAAEIRRRYDNVVEAEMKVRARKRRVEYFEGASHRELTGQVSLSGHGLATPLANSVQSGTSGLKKAKGKENRPTAAVANPVDTLARVFFDSTPDSGRHVHTLLAIDALLDLPPNQLHRCYPGESPTKDNTCPVCDAPLAGLNTKAAGHIHKCILGRTQSQALKRAYDDYVPRTCSWNKCKKKNEIWDTRPLFLKHLSQHRKSASQTSLVLCKWECGSDLDQCGEVSGGDWLLHFSQEHGINIGDMIDVQYCRLCARW